MSYLNNINKGFEIMLPRSPKEEVTIRNLVSKQLRLELFGIVLQLSFSLSRPLEKEK